MKRLCLIFIALLLITACNNASKLSMYDIITVFANNGIKLIEHNEKADYFVLNGQKALNFTLDNGEDISFFIFNSEKSRNKGRDDFTQQKDKYGIQISSSYSVKNVLIFRWYNGETSSESQYEDSINKAVDSLALR